MTNTDTAKTARVAYRRALAALGLAYGTDFRVVVAKPVYLGDHWTAEETSAELLTPHARLAVAEHITDIVEAVQADGGWRAGFHAYERGDLSMSTRNIATEPRDMNCLREVVAVAKRQLAA